MSSINAQTLEVGIRHFDKVYAYDVEPSSDVDTATTRMMTLQSRVNLFGFMLDGPTLAAVGGLDVDDLQKYADDLTEALQTFSGVRQNNQAFYPNFPQQVIDSSDLSLYIHAMIHYLGDAIGLRLVPEFPVDERVELRIDELQNVKHLKAALVDKGRVYEVLASDAKALLMSSSAISAADMDDVKVLVGDKSGYFFSLFSKSDLEKMNLENKARFLALAYENGESTESLSNLYDWGMTKATDVLRYAVARSGGDVSLATNSGSNRFKSFARSERRLMLARLNKIVVAGITEDFTRREGAFKRLATALHAGDYHKQFPHAAKAFRDLAEGNTLASFDSHYEIAKVVDDTDDLIELVSQRPGEFARRLNDILSTRHTKAERKAVVSGFAAIVDEVPENILWSMIPFFDYRNKDAQRVIHPKGAVSRSQIVPMPKKAYGNKTAQEIVSIIHVALARRYTTLPSLGKVYIEPELAGATIPAGGRSASQSMQMLGRGSRVVLDDQPVQRFFTWWKESDSQVDLDLTAVLITEDFKILNFVSYTNLMFPSRGSQRSRPSIIHSGDYTSAPQGAAEYIDVHVDDLLADGVHYVAMNLYSYNKQPFNSFEAVAGVMGRKKAQTGQIFDARTVTHKFDLAGDSLYMVPLVIDLKTREMVWADMAGSVTSVDHHNIEQNMSQTEKIVRGIVEKRHNSVYQLVALHAAARGELVDSKEEADVVYGLKDLKAIYEEFPVMV